MARPYGPVSAPNAAAEDVSVATSPGDAMEVQSCPAPAPETSTSTSWLDHVSTHCPLVTVPTAWKSRAAVVGVAGVDVVVVEPDRPPELLGWCRRMANATTSKTTATTGVANEERRAEVLRLRGRGAGVLRRVGRGAGFCRFGAGLLIHVSGLLTAAPMIPTCSMLRTPGRLRSDATTVVGAFDPCPDRLFDHI